LKYSHPPVTEAELLARAHQIAGKSLRQVAQELNLQVPADQQHHKGWIGTLAENYLVATATSLAEPDFQHIGVELKTVPVGKSGKPSESTYVSTVTLSDISGRSWETSSVRKKLARVLWLPVESDNSIPLAQRRFGDALIWSPNAEQMTILQNDWEEIIEQIATGNIDQVSSSHGLYLQIRPKAAHAGSLARSYAKDGTPTSTLPRGFYLRASFTRSILASRPLPGIVKSIP